MPEPENHTLRLLQQIHAKLEGHDEHFERASRERQEMRDQLDSIQSAVGGLAYIQADQRLQFEELEARVKRLEDQLGQTGAPAE